MPVGLKLGFKPHLPFFDPKPREGHSIARGKKPGVPPVPSLDVNSTMASISLSFPGPSYLGCLDNQNFLRRNLNQLRRLKS